MLFPARNLDRFLYFRRISRHEHRTLMREFKEKAKTTDSKKQLYHDMRSFVKQKYAIDTAKRNRFLLGLVAVAFFVVSLLLFYVYHLHENLGVTHPFVLSLLGLAAPFYRVISVPFLEVWFIFTVWKAGSFSVIQNNGIVWLVLGAVALVIVLPFVVSLVKCFFKRYERHLFLQLLLIIAFVACCFIVPEITFYVGAA